jgi:hypothetical protein
MGEGEDRYRTSFLPKNRSGSGEVVSAGTFHKRGTRYEIRGHTFNPYTTVIINPPSMRTNNNQLAVCGRMTFSL